MSPQVLRYRVRVADPHAHLFEVDLVVPEPAPDGAVLRLAAWIPGSYTIRDFARHVVRIEAEGPSGPVALTKLDKDSWQAEPCSGPLRVTILVYAWELTVRTAHLDATHAFFNGTSLFLVPDGQAHHPCEVELVPPDDPACAGWQVATTLPRLSGPDWGFGTFAAPDHDTLIDHPVEMGTWARVSFEACGVPHDVVVTGVIRADLDRLAADLAAVCAQHIRFFGEPAPFDRYLFLVMAVGDGYGGLEHRDSTALICKRSDLPAPGVAAVTEAYRGFLGLCSHEYFHAWNVKRIKPRAFVPYDLWRPNTTTQLWAFEGITSWYDDLGLLRAGLIDRAGWLELVGRTVTGVLRGAGRHRQTLADSSFDAWTKYYKQDENSPNAIVSYYTKGSLVGLCLDLELRRRTAERVGLDSVWRELWRRHGDGSGVPEGGVEAIAAELAGADLSDFFALALRSTEDLPLGELLATVGIALRLRPARDEADKGGKAASPSPDEPAPPGDLGVTATSAGGGATLKHVHHGGAAHAAGLAAGDVVVALDGLKVDAKELGARTRALGPGARVRVHAFRRDELREFEAKLLPAPATTAWLELLADAPPDVVARRDRWLEGRLLP